MLPGNRLIRRRQPFSVFSDGFQPPWYCTHFLNCINDQSWISLPHTRSWTSFLLQSREHPLEPKLQPQMVFSHRFLAPEIMIGCPSSFLITNPAAALKSTPKAIKIDFKISASGGSHLIFSWFYPVAFFLNFCMQNHFQYPPKIGMYVWSIFQVNLPIKICG